ncbi:MAG: hypothetical protein KDB05_32515, partial [Planctomycetales bacterium]|nr:hypothetical protein [Planctomycetales bacterium]
MSSSSSSSSSSKRSEEASSDPTNASCQTVWGTSEMNTLNRFNYVNMEAWIEHWADDDFVWDCLVPNSHHSPHSHMDMVTALIAQTNSSSSSSSSSGPPHRSASMVL